MKAVRIYYEVHAYPIGSNGNGATERQFGSGKNAKAAAIAKGEELWNTGEYEAVFVNAHNDEEVVDDECVTIGILKD